MIQIPHQQILDRYDTLSESLKDAGFSSYNTLLIEKIGETNHLTPDKTSTISLLVGRVLFGFIHPEDLAKEIRESLNLNPEIANSITQEIDRKIFAPIRMDLEKVYAPPSEEEVLDLRAKITEKPEEKIKVELPKVESIGGVELPKVVSLEEKPKIEGKEEIQPPKIGVPESLEAEPFIIHKEAEFKPLSETKKSLGGLFGFLKKKEERAEEKAEPARAQVEIGDKSLKTEPSKITKTEPPKVRVVHYSEFQPAVSPFPTEAEKPKAETEKIEIEIKPPENLPMVSRVEPPTETKPPIPVASGAEPLDLRQASVETKPKPETKPVPEKKEEEEMIDLSTFKKI